MGRGPKILVLFQVITSKWSISQWLDSLAEQLQLLFKFQHGSNESELYTISIWSWPLTTASLDFQILIPQYLLCSVLDENIITCSETRFFLQIHIDPQTDSNLENVYPWSSLNRVPGLRCQMGCFGQRCGPREAQEFVPRVRGSQDSSWKLKGF